MKFSKLPVICLILAGVACVSVRAEDNPAQAAARIALAKQLFEISGQSATNAAPATATSAEAAKPASAKNDKADKAAEQAEQKRLAEQQAADAKAQTAVQAAAKQESANKANAEKAALAAANAPVETKKEAKAKSEKAKSDASNYAGKDLGMKPIAAPPLPISATKEERLQALLGKYKADQLSPEEYHKQRAAILAEP